MKIRSKEETVVINLDSYEMKEFDEEVAEIDAWYDRHTRDYCIQLKNKDGFQVGEAIRCGNKADKEYMVKELKEEYSL